MIGAIFARPPRPMPNAERSECRNSERIACAPAEARALVLAVADVVDRARSGRPAGLGAVIGRHPAGAGAGGTATAPAGWRVPEQVLQPVAPALDAEERQAEVRDRVPYDVVRSRRPASATSTARPSTAIGQARAPRAARRGARVALVDLDRERAGVPP